MIGKLTHRMTASAVAASALLASAGLPAFAARPSPSISISNVTVAEGNSGQTQMLFALQVKGAWNKNMAVDYALVDGLTDGNDYASVPPGTLSFASGKRQRLAVWVNGDTLREENETFAIALTNPVGGAGIKPGGGLGTITNDDQLPVLSVDNVILGEGDTGNTPATFKFALSSASTTVVSFNYATADGSATQPADYLSTSGTVTFAAGERTKSVDVPVVGDTITEAPGSESFTLNLSNVLNATPPSVPPTGTIIDDEGAPAVSISDAAVTEGDSGMVSASFDITLSHLSATAANVSYATSNGSAIAPDDYVSADDIVNFAAGDLTKSVTVNVKGDDWNEPAEDFVVTLSGPTNAVLADVNGRGLIENDDPTPKVSVANTTVAEGNSGTVDAAFSLSLSRPTSQVVTVTYGTSDDSAVAGSDYAAATGSVTFAAGDTARTAGVSVMGDTAYEPAERFHLDVQATTNADLGDGAAVGTITNDDPAASKLSLRARKRPHRIKVKGLLTPAHGGKKVKVVLKKRRSGAWVSVRTKRALLGSGIDRNADGIRESVYRTKFRRPQKAKRCRVIVRFKGDVDHRPSKARRTFYC
ncbi:MAG: hypothetical protein M3454_00005 [Actinomycetota bacterium]|nr:hypothetical protein [Actinomycetota bacterium]